MRSPTILLVPQCLLLDGSEEEIVIGDTEEDRAAMMSKLRRMLGELH